MKRKFLSLFLVFAMSLGMSSIAYAHPAEEVEEAVESTESVEVVEARAGQDVLALNSGKTYTSQRSDSFHKGLGQKQMYLEIHVANPCVFCLGVQKKDGSFLMPIESFDLSQAGSYTLPLGRSIGYGDYSAVSFFNKSNVTYSWTLYCQ